MVFLLLVAEVAVERLVAERNSATPNDSAILCLILEFSASRVQFTRRPAGERSTQTLGSDALIFYVGYLQSIWQRRDWVHGRLALHCAS